MQCLFYVTIRPNQYFVQIKEIKQWQGQWKQLLAQFTLIYWINAHVSFIEHYVISNGETVCSAVCAMFVLDEFVIKLCSQSFMNGLLFDMNTFSYNDLTNINRLGKYVVSNETEVYCTSKIWTIILHLVQDVICLCLQAILALKILTRAHFSLKWYFSFLRTFIHVIK